MKRRKGYMLLEVVLALSIFIVAVVGLLKCLNAGLDADYEQNRLTTMRLNLQSFLDEALALPPEEQAITFPEDAFSIAYRRDIKAARVKLGNGRELPDIFKVTVVALDTTKGNKVIGELWTYVSR